jgi:hypothetical protein
MRGGGGGGGIGGEGGHSTSSACYQHLLSTTTLPRRTRPNPGCTAAARRRCGLRAPGVAWHQGRPGGARCVREQVEFKTKI